MTKFTVELRRYAPGDGLGNYTCFNNGGASVVDWLVAEFAPFKNLLNFTVLPPELDFNMNPLLLLSKCLN